MSPGSSRAAAGDPRRTAAAILDRALGAGLALDPLLEAAAPGLDERDRRLLRELVSGTVRWLRRLDHVLGSASGRTQRQIDRRLRSPLRLGAYQLLLLDRVPAHAAVNEAVEEARRRAGRGAAGFVNSVLRKIASRPDLGAWPVESDDPVARLGIETSHPDFLVRRWLGAFGGERTEALLAANNGPRAQGLLAFDDRGGRERLAAALAAAGVETEPSRLSLRGLLVCSGDPLASDAFRRGDCYLQDPASQVAAWLPPPADGERVLDAQAAPGGKSFALLAAAPAARLVAADLAPGRLARIAANQRRLGRAFPLVAADGRMPPWPAGAFDRVLLDLPCSATGTIRQHPELKWRLSEAEIRRLAARGRGLVEAGAEMVRSGGLLVVATCSLEREENEEVVDAFLDVHRDFSLHDLAGEVAGESAGGLHGRGRWRVPTAAEHDGFTVHVLERR